MPVERARLDAVWRSPQKPYLLCVLLLKGCWCGTPVADALDPALHPAHRVDPAYAGGGEIFLVFFAPLCLVFGRADALLSDVEPIVLPPS